MLNAAGGSRKLTDVLDDLANKIQGAGSQQEKLRIAFKAFDSEGAALVNLLDKGQAGLDEYRRKAEKLGIILSGDLVRGAANAKDRLNELGKVLTTSVNRAILANADAIADLAESFVDAAPKILRAARAFGEFLGLIDQSKIARLNKLRVAIAGARAKIEAGGAEPAHQGFFGPLLDVTRPLGNASRVADATKRLKIELEEFGELQRAVFARGEARSLASLGDIQLQSPTLPDLHTPLVKPIDSSAVKALTKMRLEAEASQRALFILTEEGVTAGTTLADSFGGPAKVLEELEARFQAIGIVSGLSSDGIRQYKHELESLGIVGIDLTDMLTNYILKQNEMAEKIRLATTEIKAFVPAIISAEDELAGLADGMTKAARVGAIQLREELERTAASVTGTVNPALRELTFQLSSMSDPIVDALFAGEDAFKAFGNTALNIIQEVLKEMIKLAILKPILTGIGGAIGGPVGAAFGAAGANIGKAAHGGFISGPTLVGEQGPELFLPGRGGGTVIPNDQMGGGGITIIQDFRGVKGSREIEETVMKAMIAAAPQLIGASVNAVRDERRSNPGFFGVPGGV